MTSKQDIYNKIEDSLEDGITKLYKKKVRFHKSNYKSLNTNHIVCARFIKAVLLIVALLWWLGTMGM
jgi:hypothetical protein